MTSSLRNLALGHFYNEPFIQACEPWTHRIREVFFAWPGVLSCRPAPDFTDELRQRLFNDLHWCREHGILLDTLFNCNCYGDNAISNELADFVSSVLQDMREHGLFPDVVTTTSPFIATVLRKRFPEVELRWSVNGRVHGTTGYEYIEELFDSFYITREHQREFDELEKTAAWAKAHGKTVGLQANSGCLRQCPFQQFHDNLHGHNRLRQSEVGKQFDFSVFRCRTTYQRGNYEAFLKSTWIRPEDLPHFEPYVSVVKLATRRIAKPTQILNAYASYSFDGNLLELMDPVHADLFPAPIQNKAFPKNWATSGIAAACANDCTHCGKCTTLLQQVLKPSVLPE